MASCRTPARQASVTAGGTVTPASHALIIPGLTGQPSTPDSRAAKAWRDLVPRALRTNAASPEGSAPRE